MGTSWPCSVVLWPDCESHSLPPTTLPCPPEQPSAEPTFGLTVLAMSPLYPCAPVPVRTPDRTASMACTPRTTPSPCLFALASNQTTASTCFHMAFPKKRSIEQYRSRSANPCFDPSGRSWPSAPTPASIRPRDMGAFLGPILPADAFEPSRPPPCFPCV
eukprot:EG_transcript_9107